MTQDRGSVAGRVVVVTGAGAGFGQVLTRALATARAHVLAVDRDADALEDVASDSVTPYVADVCVDADLVAVMQAARELGGPHAVVNNAGGWTPGERQFPDAEPEEWSRTLDLDLRAPMRLTQLLLRATDAGPGRVVVSVSSSGALGPSPYGSPEYAAAKAALIRLTTSLSDSEQTHGARVLCVVPGWIGLERAHRQWADLSDARRAASPDLVPPDLVADTVIRLIEDTTVASGTVVQLLDGDRVRFEPP